VTSEANGDRGVPARAVSGCSVPSHRSTTLRAGTPEQESARLSHPTPVSILIRGTGTKTKLLFNGLLALCPPGCPLLAARRTILNDADPSDDILEGEL